MPDDPTQFDPDRLRVALDHGEVVELDGGTLALDGEESPSVVLRLAPWRARSVVRVLEERSSVSRIFHHATRPHLDELDPIADAGVGRCGARRWRRADRAVGSGRPCDPQPATLGRGGSPW
jgi:hypothetical protein